MHIAVCFVVVIVLIMVFYTMGFMHGRNDR